MSKPTKSGIEGSRVVFSVDGRSYSVGASAPADTLGMLNVTQARALAASGAAVETPYLKQFPWTGQ